MLCYVCRSGKCNLYFDKEYLAMIFRYIKRDRAAALCIFFLEQYKYGNELNRED